MPNYRLILKDALKDNQIWTEKKNLHLSTH